MLTIVAVIVVVIVVVAGVLVFYYIYTPDYATHPERAATVPLAEMISSTGNNLTAWTAHSSNQTYVVTYYNLTGNATTHGYLMIMSLVVSSPSISLSMFNESLNGIRSTASILNSTSETTNASFRGFTYFIASFPAHNVFLSAGHYKTYFFYIFGTVKVANIGSIVTDEIDVMSTK
ncbi:MAG: hypothetical protein AMDU3_IPLC00004G0020 [Thermoplasmatales archaeon I-plasma]|nr:MAG: hypothetical protein AMDU3_IPLC00004G0020 [Thermoplasmatales archaeon I-plasma]